MSRIPPNSGATTDDPAATWPPSPSQNAPHGAVAETPGAPTGSLGRDLLFIAYAAFITTLAQNGVLGNLPIRFWLKNHLHADVADVSAFSFWAGLAWYFKPLFGLMIDAFPLFGTRRRWYMIVSCVFAAGAWGLVSLGQAHYGTFLLGTIVLGVFMVVASTIMGALLVEVGQRYKATGRVSAVREVVQNSCGILTGIVGGLLAKQAFGLTAGIGAGLLLTLAVVAYRFLPEVAVARKNAEVWTQAGRQLKLVFASRPLWAAAGLIVLFFFSPGFSDPLLFRQQDMLKFDEKFIGVLTSVGAIALVLGGILYGVICRRFQLRTLLFVGIVCQSLAALLYLDYRPTHQTAILIELAAGFIHGVSVLSFYDLATRATPRGGEGMGYALMMSARNLALYGAGWIGSKLILHHLPWDTLVWLNSGTTLLCLFAVPFLPGVLMRRRDGDDLGDPHATGEQISAVEPGPGSA